MRLLRDLERGGEAERAEDVHDVVVDRLGDADDGDLQSAAGDLFADCMGAALRAVAADAEQDVDALAVEEVDDHRRGPAARASWPSTVPPSLWISET